MSEVLDAMITAATAIRKGVEDVRTTRLYHYTSPDGLMGILKENKPTLFFSQYDSLNDTKERIDVFDVLKISCDRLLKKRKISKQLYDDILNIPPSNFFNISRKTNEKITLDTGEEITCTTVLATEECYTYICSFSKNNDSLPMWRMYSKADHYEGFSVEFLPSAFDWKHITNGFSIKLIKVIYDESKKIELIKNVLLPLAPLYDIASVQDKKNLLSIVKQMIADFQFVFKNKAFAYEEEVRAILHVPKTGNADCSDFVSERKYRQKNGLIIPYVVYNLNQTTIRSITIAPTIKEDIAASNLKDYLLSKGLTHVRINSSDIPIRNV